MIFFNCSAVAPNFVFIGKHKCCVPNSTKSKRSCNISMSSSNSTDQFRNMNLHTSRIHIVYRRRGDDNNDRRMMTHCVLRMQRYLCVCMCVCLWMFMEFLLLCIRITDDLYPNIK